MEEVALCLKPLIWEGGSWMNIDTPLQIGTATFGHVLGAQNWWLLGVEKIQKYLEMYRIALFDDFSGIGFF